MNSEKTLFKKSEEPWLKFLRRHLMSSSEQYLKCGWVNPYHFMEPTTPNELAACAIISNLESRSGVSLDFDTDIRNEIIAEIVDIIEKAPEAFKQFTEESQVDFDQLK